MPKPINSNFKGLRSKIKSANDNIDSPAPLDSVQGSDNHATMDAEILRLLHELEVHQVELKTQNEELLRIKEQAEQEAKKYFELYDFSPSGYFTLSREGEILDLNLAGAAMLGKYRSNLKKSKFNFFVSPATRPIFNLFIERVFNSNVKETCEIQLSIISDLPINVILSGIVMADGENCFTTALDITQSKRAEEALRTSEQRYHDLFNQANEGLLIMTLDGQLSEVNKSFANMHGYTADEIKNSDIRKLDVLGEKTLIDRDDQLSRILAGEVIRFDVEHYHKDGHIFPLSVTTSIVNINGQQFFMAFHQDITGKKRAEEGLMKESTLMKTAVENLPLIFFLIDREGKFQLSIGAGLKGLGLKPNQVVGLSAYEIYKDFPVIIDSVKRSLAGEPAHFESTVTGSSYDNYLAPIYDVEGRSFGIAGVAMDITGSKLAKDAIQAGRDYLDKIINSVASPIFVKDDKHKFTLVNDAFCVFHGRTVEQLIGSTGYETFSKEQLEVFIAKDKLVFDTGEENINEEFVNAAEGKVRTVITRKTLYTDASGNKYLVGVINDITERKQAEQSLQEKNLKIEAQNTELIISKDKAEESEKKFRKSIENAPYPLMIHAEGEVIQLSEAWTRISGYTIIDIPNIVQWTSKAYGENAIPSQEFIDKLYEIDSMQYDGEWEITIKNGEKRIWDFSTSPIGILSDGRKAVISMAADITDRKIVENKLEIQNKELIISTEKAKESDRLKTAFLANMSHEIRTPMNGILGFSDLLKEPGLSGEEQREYINIIEKSGARMLNIISEIMDISKIESGQMEIFLNEVDINEKLKDVYKLLKPEADSKKLDLSFKSLMPDEKAITLTDRNKFDSILTNLVKNAIKYTDKGSIAFGCEIVETSHDLSLLQFYVKDTGIGIPKDRQEAIFERFIQADIQDIMARQGAGLGLSIAKAFVEMLGGRIWVESEVGEGSTFYFALPNQKALSKYALDQSTGSNPNPGIANSPFVPRLKILIAEDDETSEMILSILTKDISREVLKAINGLEAVEICRNNPDIDLILMDINMPEMGGYEATGQIRQFNQDVVIIAQTAYGLVGDREKSIQAGCNEHISKPIRKEGLIGLIKKFSKD